MKKLFTVLICGCLLWGTPLIAQDTGRHFHALETNLLGWASGHAGPELRLAFGREKNFEYYIGAKYALFTPFVQGAASDDLRSYRQSLRGGADLTLGMRLLAGPVYPGLFVQYGRYSYNNRQTVCNRFTHVAPDSLFYDYCRCEEVVQNDFREIVNKYAAGIDLSWPALQLGTVSVILNASLQLNLLTRRREDYRLHAPCGEIPGGGSLPEWYGGDNAIWLQGIPSFREEFYAKGNYMAARFSIWIRWTR